MSDKTRNALVLADAALAVATEIADRAFTDARGERGGSPGEGQWEDLMQIQHAHSEVKVALAKYSGGKG